MTNLNLLAGDKVSGQPVVDPSMVTNETNDTNQKSAQPPVFEKDALFIVTDLTKQLFGMVSWSLQEFKKSSVYRILSNTTQPIHVISIILVAVLSAKFFPVEKRCSSNFLASRFTCFTYFTSFSLHVGSQFWMTFVSGLSLYFNLGRHAFGDVQKILFPRYFTLNCILSAVTLIQFGRLHAMTYEEWDLLTTCQIISLTLCFVMEFSIRVYLVPTVLELIETKTIMEKTAGIGHEVGGYELGPLLKCPHYMSVHKRFRKVHMFTAIGNIIAIMCSAFHMYFLAYQWTNKLMDIM